MTEYLINKDTLTDIADAIRDKNGTTDPIPANEMAAQIAAISTGINPEDVPEEVYIGTTEPTDENVKIWINPDEPSTPGGGSKDWQEGYYDSNSAYVGSDTRHAKVIGYFGESDNNLVTFDVSLHYDFGGNNCYIHMPTVYIDDNEYNISFYNDYGTLRVRDSNHSDYYSFTITGCYYWG